MHPYISIGLAYSAFGLLAVSADSLPNPVICEDSLDGQPPFDSKDVPCLLQCGAPIARATGSLLPGSVNTTDIPYCQLNCVREDATPAQSSAAPGCYQRCQAHNQATPENVGWCMYWCVDGLGDLVASTACVPSLEFGQPVTSTIDGHTGVVRPFTHPAAWVSWYETETAIPRTGDVVHSTSVTSVILPDQSSTASPQITTAAKGSGSAQATQQSRTAATTAEVASAVGASGQQGKPSPTKSLAIVVSPYGSIPLVLSISGLAVACLL